VTKVILWSTSRSKLEWYTVQ